MDPLSIASSIAALLQLTSIVIKYLVDASGSSKDRREVLNAVSSTSGFLFVLKDLAERAKLTDSWSTTIRALAVPNGPLDQFKASVERLASILGTNSSRNGQRVLVWPFQKGEIKEILETIERQKGLFLLALQNDHINLSREIKGDMERVQDGVNKIGYQLSSLQLGQEMWLQEKERRDLLVWLTPLNFWNKQNDVFARRQPGTGEWLLKHNIFEQWLSGIKKTLWYPGIPGAGKTVLASVAINYLEQRFKRDDVGIVYIYCTYREKSHTAVNLVASLLKQLVQQQPAVSTNILDLYKHHRGRQTRPSLTEYSRFLQAELRHFSKVFIVIDALDECPEEGRTRDHFLAEVQKLLPMVSILVTSRHLPDLEYKFEDAARFEIYASGSDIRRYLECRIERELLGSLKPDLAFRAEILNTIVEKANRMFLLAQLHMDSLGREDTLRGVKRALRDLPEALDGTYEETLKRILSQNPQKAKRARQVLSWICNAARPVTVDEVRYALAVEPDDRDMDEEALLDEGLLVSVCAGLVTIDRDSNIIRFVHYTARQYFENNCIDFFGAAQTEIARICLTYLSFDKFAAGHCSTDEEMETRMQEYPLLQYASQYWGDHARGDTEHDLTTQEMIMNFLAQECKISCSIQATHIPKYRCERYSQQFPKGVAGLELAATLGLEEITRRLLEAGADVDKKDSDGGTALHWAAWGGYETVVRLLLENGANIHAEYSSKGTPLHWAAEGGHLHVVRLLLDYKANIAAEDVRRWTPMHRAAWNGYDRVVRFFLENKLDINARDSDGGSILHAAAENGHEAVLKLLLEEGAEVNCKDPDGGTPLHRAAWNGHDAVVRLLLEKGADVHAKYSYGQTPQGSKSGQEVVVRLLLEKGAKVAAKYFCGGTALHWAAWSGHEAVVRLLIDRGADFAAKDSDGGTALSGAAEIGNKAVVQVLLEKTADFSVELSDEERAVKHLLDRAAKSPGNGEDEGVSTALHWAAWDGREKVVRPLLEDKTSVNSTNLHGRTALHWAAWSGHKNIVELLLEKGADISVKDNGKWTALHWAAWNGHKAIVQSLLDKGADATAKDLHGKTAQDWADASEHIAVVQLLAVNSTHSITSTT